MRLDYGDAWRRGDGAEEAEDDAYILRAPGGPDALTLYAPRRAVPLKTDATRFHEQLERKWRAQYGDAARISTVTSAGHAWHLCIRPSLEKPATVFHLVTVQAGRAHHLIAIGAQGTRELPPEVMTLIAGTHWRESESVIIASAEMPKPPEATSNMPGNANTPNAGPTTNADTWRLVRGIRSVSRGDALATLADAEATQLGDAGMLTGYALSMPENALEWFVDGYQFDPLIPGKAGRKRFAHAWRLDWTPPEQIRSGQAYDLPIRFSGAASEAPATDSAGLRAEIRLLCGADAALTRLTDELDSHGRELEARLIDMTRACANAAPTTPSASVIATGRERELAAGGGLSMTLRIAPVPEAPASLPPGQSARLLIVMRGIASTQGNAAGDALLGGATAYYLYVWQAQP
jgi:hypothetical protein